jgi:hypothetical protein
MRRFIVVATALTFMATVTVTGTAGARAIKRHQPIGRITAGSVWTLYDQDYTAGITSCSVLAFSKGFGFTDSDGGSGQWSANAKLEWESAGYLVDGSDYRGKFDPDANNKEYIGTVSALSGTWGEFVLVAGNDPLNAGTCAPAST